MFYATQTRLRFSLILARFCQQRFCLHAVGWTPDMDTLTFSPDLLSCMRVGLNYSPQFPIMTQNLSLRCYSNK